MPATKLTLEQQIAKAEAKLNALKAKAKSDGLQKAVNDNKQVIAKLYADLKTASGKKRGVDADILIAIAEAMGAKGATITKKQQNRSKS
jgi:hypothetical protein